MQNLVLYTSDRISFDLPSKNVKTCIKVDNRMYVVTSVDDTYELLSYEGVALKKQVDLPPDILPESLKYIEADERVFIAAGGCFIFLSADLETCEYVDVGTNEILAAVWNPMQDLLAVYQDDGTVGCYGVTFEPAYASILNCSSLEDQPVNNVYVGWGSSKTQFKGKRGKGYVEEESTYKCKDTIPRIDWRGNSEMFAINIFNGEERLIKIFNKDCEILYVTSNETLAGLESLVAYRPAGNMIACVTSRHGQDQNLTFIEKNGEVLDILELTSNVKVFDLKWSPCGYCLAVYQKHRESDEAFIDLYLSVNYSWILKQRLSINPDNKLINFTFTLALKNVICLETFLENGYYKYIFNRKFIKSQKRSEDFGLTCCINNDKLLNYFYIDGINAPDADIGNYTLQHDKCINSVIIDNETYRIALIDFENNVNIYDYSERNNWKKLTEFKLENELKSALSNYFFCFNKTGDEFIAVSLTCNDDIKTSYDLVNDSVTRTDVLTKIIYSDDKTEVLSTDCQLPIADLCIVNLNEQIFKFVLTPVGSLYVNNVEINGNITSMHVHENRYFLFTAFKTKGEECTEELISLPLTLDNVNNLLNGGDLFDMAYHRPVEQGALILNTIPNEPVAVLVMPRGNSECVIVRNVALSTLSDLLKEKKYRRAYSFAKFQSLQLDLFIDLDIDAFVTNLNEMFTSLGFNVMNKFILDLKDESSLDGEDLKVIQPKVVANKRKQICEAFLKTLLTLEECHKYSGTVALSVLHKTYPNYDTANALKTIATICGDYKSNRAYLEQALDLINLYVPYEEQYQVALSFYDVELAEIIARKSNMDPKEYESLLRVLRDVSEIEKRFKICDLLRNCDAAVLYAVCMREEGLLSDEKLLNYASTKCCVRVLYENLSPSDGELFKEVSLIYAKELQLKASFEEAALVSYRVQNYREASNFFMKKLNWREAISVLSKARLNETETKELFYTIASTLEHNKKHQEAANVFFDYCKDQESGFRSLLDGRLYQEAYRLACFHSNELFIEEDLIPHMQTFYNDLNNKLQSTSVTFVKHLNRLKEVREEMKNYVVKMDEYGGYIEDDLYSDTESIRSRSSKTSLSSKASRNTARKQRREERKYTDFKTGSRYEDIALMTELHKIVTETFDLSKDVRSVCSLLKLLNGFETNLLLARLADLKRFMHDVSGDIWPVELVQFESQQDTVYRNITHLPNKFRTKPENIKLD